MNIIDEIEQEQIKEISQKRNVPEFGPGDTLKIHLKVLEGNRERIQVFEGVCIARSNKGLNSSFTVRKISNGEGVERVFPVYSPLIEKFEVVRRGDVIPHIEEVLTPSETGEGSMPNYKYTWNKTGIEIVLDKSESIVDIIKEKNIKEL